MDMNLSDAEKRYNSEYGKLMEYNKWCREIPYLRFPSDWDIKIIPPFGGAVVRFIVKKGDKSISVYLDCYDVLAWMKEPYWEIVKEYFKDEDSIEAIFEKCKTEIKEKEPMILKWFDDNGYYVISKNTRLIAYGYNICKKGSLIPKVYYSFEEILNNIENESSPSLETNK